VIGRTSTLALWAVVAAGIIAAYILGKIRSPRRQPGAGHGRGRLLTATLFLVLALWLAAGLFGHHLGVVEAWFPADEAPGRSYQLEGRVRVSSLRSLPKRAKT